MIVGKNNDDYETKFQTIFYQLFVHLIWLCHVTHFKLNGENAKIIKKT